MPRLRDHLLTTVDLVATFILALEFAVAAVHADLDLFGILVLATVGATGGGIMRDLLLGEHPPAALRDWRYVTIAIAAASTIIVIGTWRGAIGGWTAPVVLDVIEAAGLAFAAVAGAQKAIDYELNAASVALLAVVGSCGGGVLRDVLTAHVPRILRADFYATAALIGAVVMVVLIRHVGVRQSMAASITGVVVLTRRAPRRMEFASPEVRLPNRCSFRHQHSCQLGSPLRQHHRTCCGRFHQWLCLCFRRSSSMI